ncbi:MAG: ABC transporter permease [Chloroflexota bacterium]
MTLLQNVLSGIFSAAFLGAMLRVTTPILLPSLGALISDRAGVINIGLEGIMLSAAFTGATVGAYAATAVDPSIAAWVGFGAAIVVAVLVALLLAFFHLQLNGDLILGGIAINILGSAATIAIGYQLTGGRGGGSLGLAGVQMPIVDLPFLKAIPAIGDGLYTILGSQNIMTWISFLSVAVIWFLLYRMPIGKHLRAVGENPDAAASVGIDVRRVRYLALAISGVLAGLGGIHLSMGYLNGFTRDMTAGRGFIALVAPALGGGTPFGTMIAALLFGAFAGLETRLPSLLPGVDIPSQLPQIIPYAATIIALVIYSYQRTRALTARARRFEQQRKQEPAPTPSGPSD